MPADHGPAAVGHFIPWMDRGVPSSVIFHIVAAMDPRSARRAPAVPTPVRSPLHGAEEKA